MPNEMHRVAELWDQAPVTKKCFGIILLIVARPVPSPLVIERLIET